MISVSSPKTEVRIIAAGLEFPEGPAALADGSVLVTEIAAGTHSRVSLEGQVERITHLGGGPNGAAIVPDGSGITEKIFPLDSPNGIAQAPDGSRLYVAETQVGRIWYWDLEGPGKIASNADGEFHPGKLLYGAPGYALFDSMKVDGEGWVCQATLIDGGVMQISPDGQRVEILPLSDPMITNLCFGGPDYRTAFITCPGTGYLIAVDWQRAGGRLAFSTTVPA
jgi:sugar lactone lactonase YvrE